MIQTTICSKHKVHLLIYALSPRIRRASWISLGMIVTRLAWIAHKLVSSKRPTRYASLASWSARTAVDWNRKSVLKSCAISRTRRWKGALRMSKSVLFWYLRISRSATVPGRYLWGFFTPPAVGADFLAAYDGIWLSEESLKGKLVCQRKKVKADLSSLQREFYYTLYIIYHKLLFTYTLWIHEKYFMVIFFLWCATYWIRRSIQATNM